MFKFRKSITILYIFIFCLSIGGCRSDKDSKETGSNYALLNPDNDFIAESILLPEYGVLVAPVLHNNTLYYYAEDQQVGTPEPSGALYRLEIDGDTGEPEAIPLSLAADEVIGGIRVTDDGRINLLVLKIDFSKEPFPLIQLSWDQLDQQGNPLASFPLMDFLTEKDRERGYPQIFILDEKGSAYFVIRNTVYVIGQDGNLLYHTQTNNSEEYITTLFTDGQGEIYGAWYGMDGINIARLDSQTKGFAGVQSIPELSELLGANPGPPGELLLASPTGVFRYELKSKNLTEVFNWIDLNVKADIGGDFMPLPDGRVLWLRYEYLEAGLNSDLSLIRPREKGEKGASEKQVLTLGGISTAIDMSLREEIVAFNGSNPDFRIEVLEYSDDDAGNNRLNTDIVTGNGPDIMVLPSRFSMSLYAEKGILTDLYPFMAGDETNRKENFQENVLKAFESEGKLYAIPLSYRILTMVGSKAQIGDRNSWNLDEMIRFTANYFPESQVFEEPSKSHVLDYCLMANGDALVDWHQGAESFQRDLFIKMLEFSNQFISDSSYVYDDNIYKRVREDNQLQLMWTNISDVGNYQSIQQIFGETVAFPGYPSEKGNGSIIDSGNILAINSQCAHQDAAWELISRMLGENFQSDPMMFRFPIRKSSLEKQFERARTAQFETDENGRQQEIPREVSLVGDATIEVYAAEEADIQGVRNLIDSANKIRNWDEQITNIVKEEAAAYFNGGKTAAETADVVENRIRTYINEEIDP